MDKSNINTSDNIMEEEENEKLNNTNEKTNVEGDGSIATENTLPQWEYNPQIMPRDIYIFNYEKDCFLRHCYFSPDGYCILSNDNSNTLKYIITL